MRGVALARFDLHFFPFAKDVRLAHVEVDAAALCPRLFEDAGQLRHIRAEGGDVCVFRDRLRIPRQNGGDLRIRHPVAGADDALAQFAADDLAPPVHFHKTGESVAVFPFVERTGAV